jgi:hypothetical protein
MSDRSEALSSRWAKTRREREAVRYEEVAQQIAEGRLKISGTATAAGVEARMLDKAKRVRNGERVKPIKRTIRRSRRLDLRLSPASAVDESYVTDDGPELDFGPY